MLNIFVLVTMSVEVGLGTKLAQAGESVGLRIDMTLLHSCTFFFLVTELLCPLDHSSNAVALAQDCHKTELHLSLSLSLSSWGWQAGQSPRRDSQALCLTSSDRVLVFLCASLVFQWHISHLFARGLAVGSLALVCQVQAEQVVVSELVSQLRTSYTR